MFIMASAKMACGSIQMDAEPDSGDEESIAVHSSGSSDHRSQRDISYPSALFQTARPYSPSDDTEYLEYLKHMPRELQEDTFDILIINAEKDVEEARNFQHHLRKDIIFNIHDESRQPTVKLLEEIIDGSADNLDLAFEKALYVFLYVTKEFCGCTWSLLRGQACLTQAIDDPDRRWCVIPIRTHSRKNQQCRLPMMLNTLKAINYWSGDGDQFYVDSVKRLLESKTGLILERERILDERRRAYYEKNKPRFQQNYRHHIRKSRDAKSHQGAQTPVKEESNKSALQMKGSFQDSDTQCAVLEHSSVPEDADSKAVPEQTETVFERSSAVNMTQPTETSLNVNLRHQNDQRMSNVMSQSSSRESMLVASSSNLGVGHSHTRAPVSDNSDRRLVVDNSSASSNRHPSVHVEPDSRLQRDGPASVDPVDRQMPAGVNMQSHTVLPPCSSEATSSVCGVSSDAMRRFAPDLQFDEHGRPYFVSQQTGHSQPLYFYSPPYPMYYIPPLSTTNVAPPHGNAANTPVITSANTPVILPQPAMFFPGNINPHFNPSLMSTMANASSFQGGFSVGSMGQSSSDQGFQNFRPFHSEDAAHASSSLNNLTSLPQTLNNCLSSNLPSYSSAMTATQQGSNNPASHDETSVKNPSGVSHGKSSSATSAGVPPKIVHHYHYKKRISIKHATNVVIGDGSKLYNTTDTGTVDEDSDESDYKDDDNSASDEEETHDVRDPDSSINPMRSENPSTYTRGSVPVADAAPSTTPHPTGAQIPDKEETSSTVDSQGYPELASSTSLNQSLHALNISNNPATDEEEETDVKKLE